jgi:hypothetical protein
MVVLLGATPGATDGFYGQGHSKEDLAVELKDGAIAIARVEIFNVVNYGRLKRVGKMGLDLMGTGIKHSIGGMYCNSKEKKDN